MRPRLAAPLALVLVAGTASLAQAGSIHSLGRWLGLGWSDGYHAREPQAHVIWHEPAPAHVLPRPLPGPTAPPKELTPPATPRTSRRAAPKLPSELHRPNPVFRTP